jgi:hypothetical protein
MNHEIGKKPENFDWVTARSNCSLVVVFEKLKHQIGVDVQTRNALRPVGLHYAFRLVDNGSNTFAVLVESNFANPAVRFTLDADKISIAASDGPKCEASVTLCDDGECRLKIANQTYDLWQVRKMALEELFFRAY